MGPPKNFGFRHLRHSTWFTWPGYQSPPSLLPSNLIPLHSTPHHHTTPPYPTHRQDDEAGLVLTFEARFSHLNATIPSGQFDLSISFVLSYHLPVRWPS
ncbi:unnamed protein product [Protopolystoma xenopodis]|uniref:Uncharacterized protein n=1 Tax=Protopolystoma xenopodis TaxID=117903 RepID=A0A3S5BYM2_9PLAT|nr:unnamed protein product [Protopolystoma xenopodis]